MTSVNQRNSTRSKELNQLLTSRPAAFIRYGVLFPLGMIGLLLVISSFFITVSKNVNIPAQLSYDGNQLWVNILPGADINRQMREWINNKTIQLLPLENQPDSSRIFVIRGRLQLRNSGMILGNDNLPQPAKDSLLDKKTILKRIITFESPVRISFTKALLLNL